MLKYMGTLTLPFTNKSNDFVRIIGFQGIAGGPSHWRAVITDKNDNEIDSFGTWLDTDATTYPYVLSQDTIHGIIPPLGGVNSPDSDTYVLHAVQGSLEEVLRIS